MQQHIAWYEVEVGENGGGVGRKRVFFWLSGARV